MVEGPRNNALIKVDSFDLQALCENTRSQNFNHKVASWPRSSTWKQPTELFLTLKANHQPCWAWNISVEQKCVLLFSGPEKNQQL